MNMTLVESQTNEIRGIRDGLTFSWFSPSIVVANVLADRYNKSYDSTANKRYSLSEQTVKIVKGLKQPATITYFDQNARFQRLRTCWIATRIFRRRFTWITSTPTKSRRLARAAGVKNYGTAVVQIGDKKEEAKSVTEQASPARSFAI